MMNYQESTERQLQLVMMMLSDIRPGCVCLDTSCPTGWRVPHMATDGAGHPHPYGVIETATHEWRRKRWWRRMRRRGS
jgi:hypothetical protein